MQIARSRNRFCNLSIHFLRDSLSSSTAREYRITSYQICSNISINSEIYLHIHVEVAWQAVWLLASLEERNEMITVSTEVMKSWQGSMVTHTEFGCERVGRSGLDGIGLGVT